MHATLEVNDYPFLNQWYLIWLAWFHVSIKKSVTCLENISTQELIFFKQGYPFVVQKVKTLSFRLLIYTKNISTYSHLIIFRWSFTSCFITTSFESIWSIISTRNHKTSKTYKVSVYIIVLLFWKFTFWCFNFFWVWNWMIIEISDPSETKILIRALCQNY